jgi:hypothetical protein
MILTIAETWCALELGEFTTSSSYFILGWRYTKATALATLTLFQRLVDDEGIVTLSSSTIETFCELIFEEASDIKQPGVLISEAAPVI